jgi:hypothetical protein
MLVKYITLIHGIGKLPTGTFTGKGDWIIFKCFYEKDGQYAEFFMNLNPAKGVIEFLPKDPMYEPVLTSAFAKAMQW